MLSQKLILAFITMLILCGCRFEPFYTCGDDGETCVFIPISGKVRNRSNSDQGIAGIKVDATLVDDGGYSLFGPKKDQLLGIMITNASGDFSMIASVEDREFESHDIGVSVSTDTDYLILQPTQELTDLPNDTLTVLMFNFYEKTQMAIHLHRTGTDTFQHFRCKIGYDRENWIGPDFNYWRQVFSVSASDVVTDSVYLTTTAANVPSTIVTMKSYPDESMQSDTFQITPTAGQLDTLHITY